MTGLANGLRPGEADLGAPGLTVRTSADGIVALLPTGGDPGWLARSSTNADRGLLDLAVIAPAAHVVLAAALWRDAG
jgi:hypothetical protein